MRWDHQKILARLLYKFRTNSSAWSAERTTHIIIRQKLNSHKKTIKSNPPFQEKKTRSTGKGKEEEDSLFGNSKHIVNKSLNHLLRFFNLFPIRKKLRKRRKREINNIQTQMEAQIQATNRRKKRKTWRTKLGNRKRERDRNYRNWIFRKKKQRRFLT